MKPRPAVPDRQQWGVVREYLHRGNDVDVVMPMRGHLRVNLGFQIAVTYSLTRAADVVGAKRRSQA